MMSAEELVDRRRRDLLLGWRLVRVRRRVVLVRRPVGLERLARRRLGLVRRPVGGARVAAGGWGSSGGRWVGLERRPVGGARAARAAAGASRAAAGGARAARAAARVLSVNRACLLCVNSGLYFRIEFWATELIQ